MRFSVLLLLPLVLRAESFQLPTANRALFEPNGEARFFVPTAGKTNWMSGCFGCVRSEGWQMHEGLDIRCLKRDKRGEPIDPVMATADGKVAYINKKPSLSNYGNYIVLRHRIQNIEIYSLYAHLREIMVSTGQIVRRREIIGTVGQDPDKLFAPHLHLELRWDQTLSPTYWPSSNGKDVAWIKEHYTAPSPFINGHRSLPLPSQ